MALYPLGPLGIATQIGILDDMQVDRSIDGTPRFRGFYTAARREYVIDHQSLTPAEAATFWSWYGTYRGGVAFQIAPDANDQAALVNVMISGPPRVRYLGKGLIGASLPVTEAA